MFNWIQPDPEIDETWEQASVCLGKHLGTFHLEVFGSNGQARSWELSRSIYWTVVRGEANSVEEAKKCVIKAFLDHMEGLRQDCENWRQQEILLRTIK